SVSPDSILANVQRLQDFVTRNSYHDSCYAAAEWIFDKFVGLGLDSVYCESIPTSPPIPPNIVGIKHGTMYPDSCYTIICGHFDALVPFLPDTAPGADDNASGVAAVLEAARIMNEYQFEVNIRFIALSNEEQGMDGSWFYAWNASQQGHDIHAVYNMDMIAYVDAHPESVDVCGDTFCEPLIDHFIACADTYTTLLTAKRLGLVLADEWPFQFYGFQAILTIEDWPETNPHKHTPADTIGAGFNNLTFCTEVVMANIAALASSSVPVGIVEKEKYHAKKIVLYPTIVTGVFMLPTDKKYSIYDITGRVVSPDRLRPGIYFVEIDGVITQKIIKLK
ncbi:MAG: M20/M25/M40 family metallo-hydrolase, partial [candidate division WOR-3 bacterium]